MTALPDVSFEYFSTNGIRLHAAVAGPANGPLVLLLHGFPEFWYGMRRQIEPLAQAGYRVVAPDQRGYNKSDKPRGIDAYRMDKLTADAIGLIDACGRERAVVIGHDWGAAVAWWAGITQPQRLYGMGILNVPHPTVMRKFLLSSPAQMLKSWYVFALQLPKLPEWSCGLRNFQSLVDGLKSSSRPGTFTDEDFVQYRQAWSQPGALEATINWYRAAVRRPAPAPPSVRVTVPSLILWGTADKFVSRALAEPSRAMCDQAELELFEGTSHWIAHEEPDRVNARLLAFCRRVSPVG